MLHNIKAVCAIVSCNHNRPNLSTQLLLLHITYSAHKLTVHCMEPTKHFGMSSTLYYMQVCIYKLK